MGLILVFLVGILLLAAPIALPIAGIDLPLTASLAMLGIGAFLVITVGLLFIFKKLYVKTRADTAFVRTGRGFKIIKDGGAIVIPFLHEVVWVSLKTFEIPIDRRGKDALLTKDKLRADVVAEFYVKVQPENDHIGAASRSFGENMNQQGIRAVVEKKLISALRTVAAQKSLEELNSDRAAFMEKVTEICAQDLVHNGLTLEAAAISHLDQTSTEALDPNNVFDAQGLRTIAEITERNKTETNEMVRAGEEARKRKDVETRKAMLTLEQDKERAEAEQSAEVAKIKAEQERAAKEKQIEAAKAVELAQVAKEEATEVAKRQQQSAIEVAEQTKDEAVEVATRKKEASIALAEKERAEKQAEQAEAEKIRQERHEEIKTVTVVQEAERKRQQQVIDAQADAERKLISEQKAADASAYKVEKDAQARKAAADADAEATRKKAEAERDAEVAKAKGKEALEMVPIQVKKAEVDVEKRRVEEVVVPELKAREEHGKSQQDFELAQLAISADKEVRIEAARASVAIYQRMEVRALTTLDEVDKVRGRIVQGEGGANLLRGFLENLDANALGDAVAAAKSVVDTVRGTGGKNGANGASGSEEDTPEVPTVTKKPITSSVVPKAPVIPAAPKQENKPKDQPTK